MFGVRRFVVHGESLGRTRFLRVLDETTTRRLRRRNRGVVGPPRVINQRHRVLRYSEGSRETVVLLIVAANDDRIAGTGLRYRSNSQQHRRHLSRRRRYHANSHAIQIAFQLADVQL